MASGPTCGSLMYIAAFILSLGCAIVHTSVQECSLMLETVQLPDGCTVNGNTTFSRFFCDLSSCTTCSLEFQQSTCCCLPFKQVKIQAECSNTIAFSVQNTSRCDCSSCDDTQTTLQITVISTKGDTPVTTAQIFRVDSMELLGITRSNGQFLFREPLRNDSITIEVRAPGFVTQTQSIFLKPGHELITLMVHLIPLEMQQVGLGGSAMNLHLGQAIISAPAAGFHKLNTNEELSGIQKRQQGQATVLEDEDIPLSVFAAIAMILNANCWIQVRTFDMAGDAFSGTFVTLEQMSSIAGNEFLYRFGTNTGSQQTALDGLAPNAVCLPLACNNFTTSSVEARTSFMPVASPQLIPIRFPLDTFTAMENVPEVFALNFSFESVVIRSDPLPFYSSQSECVSSGRENTSEADVRDFFSFAGIGTDIQLLLHFSTGLFTTTEGTPSVSVCVDADNPEDIGNRTIPVTVSSTPGTAQGGAVDYGPLPMNTVIFSGNINQTCIVIPIIDDTLVEGTESFIVTLSTSDPGNANLIAPVAATVSIVDNDVPPLDLHFMANFIDVAEGTLTMLVCVVADNPQDIAGRVIPVTVSATNGSALGGGVDYGPIICNPLEFSGNDSQECCIIPINDDNFVEGTESYTVSLSTTASAMVANLTAPKQAQVSISDNDFPLQVGFEFLSYNVNEGNQQEVCATMFSPAGGGATVLQNPVQVTVASSDLTAIAGADYIVVTQTLTFPSGAAVGSSFGRLCFVFQTLADITPEIDESLQLTLTSSSTVFLVVQADQGTATVTIEDDDDCNLTSSNYCIISEVEIDDGNVQEVIRNLTTLVEEAGVDDQTAINFAVITEVIVDTSRVVAETLVIPLTEQIMVISDVVAIIGEVQMWPLRATNQTSSRIIAFFESLVSAIVRDENFTNLHFTLEDVALVAERVDRPELVVNGRMIGFGTRDDGGVFIGTGSTTTLPEDQDASIALPPSLFIQINDSEVGIVFTFYETATLFPLPDEFRNTLTIGSAVIGALVVDHSFTDLRNPVIILLRLISQENVTNPRCASWNFTAAGGRGNWSTDGCELTGNENGVITCACNHLTNFAILVDICTRIGGCVELSPTIQVALSAISIAGIALSLLGLVLTIVTMVAFKKLRQRDVSKFHTQLCVALFSLLIVFVSGIEPKNTKGGCVTASVLMHYFTLVFWMWMGAVAILMFQKLVIVFVHITTRHIVAVSLICWLIPIVPVTIPLIINPDFMITFSPASDTELRYCFIGNTGVFFGAFLGPIFLIMLFNTVIFVVVISVLIKHSHLGKKDQVKRRKVFRLMISIVGVMALFGLMWIFAAFTVSEGSIAFQFLFAIFNSLQGLFIFLFFCVFGNDGRQLWLQALCCRRKVPSTAVSKTPVKQQQHVSNKPSDHSAAVSTDLRSGDPEGNTGVYPSTISEREASQDISMVKVNPAAVELEAVEKQSWNMHPSFSNPPAEPLAVAGQQNDGNPPPLEAVQDLSEEYLSGLVRHRSTLQHHVEMFELKFDDCT